MSDFKGKPTKIVWLDDGTKEYVHDWDEVGQHESPIETELHRLIRGAFGENTTVIPQYEIGPYRVDFAVKIKLANSTALVVIECDGKEFHRNIFRDAERERALCKLGVDHVIRATGSDIFSRPVETLARIKLAVAFYEGGRK